MRFIISLITVFVCLTPTAFGELTAADIDKIRLLIKEEIAASEARMKEEITASEARMKEEISASETRMKEEIATSEARIRSDIGGKIEAVNATLQQMDKRLNEHFMLIIALFAFVAVVIGVPQIIVAMQRRDQRTQNQKIEAQQKELELLRAEMDTLRAERTFSP